MQLAASFGGPTVSSLKTPAKRGELCLVPSTRSNLYICSLCRPGVCVCATATCQLFQVSIIRGVSPKVSPGLILPFFAGVPLVRDLPKCATLVVDTVAKSVAKVYDLRYVACSPPGSCALTFVGESATKELF